MTNKTKVEVNIDCDVYEQVINKIDNLDDFIELKLREYLQDQFSEEVKILGLIQEKYNELIILEDKLVEARSYRLREVSDESIYDKIMPTIIRIHEHHGYIGKNQIKQFAKRESIPYDALLEHVRETGLTIVNYT